MIWDYYYYSTKMEYQKIMDLLDNAPNQPSKFKTINWVEINDESRGTCNKDDQIEFKNSMLRLRLCEYSDACIFVKGTTVKNTAAQGQANNGVIKKIIFKACAPFTNCISRINNTQADNVHDIDVVMYNSIE